jgi:uncharacterized membrane protein YqaE (UPF0057 family)
MRFILAIFLPPLAVLLCGKPIQALVNVLLTLCFWLPGVLHAMYVVMRTDADRRQDRLIREMRKS